MVHADESDVDERERAGREDDETRVEEGAGAVEREGRVFGGDLGGRTSMGGEGCFYGGLGRAGEPVQ